MKSLLFMVIAFLTIQIGWGQIKGGEIIYKVEVLKGSNNSLDSLFSQHEEVKSFIERELHKVDLIIPYLAYKLKFNESNGFFYHEEMMETDSGLDLKSAQYQVGVWGKYYTNLPNKTNVREFDDVETIFLLKTRFEETKWEIKDEIKIIEGYKCKKAITTISFNGIVSKEIEVWFAPALPFSYGPAGLSGLPGMILGFKRGDYFLYAAKIKLNPSEIQIPEVKKGETISMEEYEDYVREFDKKIKMNRLD